MNETHLTVHGMTCGSCVRHVERALSDLDGVTSVEVKLREGAVRVQHEPDVEPAALALAVQEAGYTAEITA